MKTWYCSQEGRRLTPQQMDAKEHCGNCTTRLHFERVEKKRWSAKAGHFCLASKRPNGGKTI